MGSRQIFIRHTEQPLSWLSRTLRYSSPASRPISTEQDAELVAGEVEVHQPLELVDLCGQCGELVVGEIQHPQPVELAGQQAGW